MIRRVMIAVSVGSMAVIGGTIAGMCGEIGSLLIIGVAFVVCAGVFGWLGRQVEKARERMKMPEVE